MVLLKKTLQVEERYPYPVRLEAMYEVIDQSPMRKLEKRRQAGFVQKCKEAGVEGQVEEATHTGLCSFTYIYRCILKYFSCKMIKTRLVGLILIHKGNQIIRM